MRPLLRRFSLLAALALAFVSAAAAQTTDFARLSARLSETGGYFDSDNLISNETSYLHVLGGFRSIGVRGGAYIGVGPEQSFSYIAETRPREAFIIDIRRDNLLLHLLLKAMFETAHNRMEYLCLLFGRPVPKDRGAWDNAELVRILDYVGVARADSALHDRQHRDLMRKVERYGFPLTPEDRATLRRFHDEFAIYGLELRYTSLGRPSRPNYPTVRRLYLETDLDGNPGSYLATEARWRFVRDLERHDKIIPVVGDLGGPRALRNIGQYMAEQGEVVGVFYLSNVEQYLFRDGKFTAFAENVRELPWSPTSVMVRSWFGFRGGMYGGPYGGAWTGSPPLPVTMPGHFSAQLLQTFTSFRALTAQPDTVSYWMLLTDTVELRAPEPAARP